LILEGFTLEIPHETYQLDNGLRVILIEDHTSPQVVVNTWYQVGSYDDPQGASGFAHLFEHLMFMGTTAIPNKDFDIRMEVVGGWNNASTGDDRTNYYDVGPSEIADLLVYMEADRMVNLDITQNKLDLQREVVRNERRQNYEDAPYGKVWLEMPEMLYPESHPYHFEGIGSHEDLLAATLDTVNKFYQAWYSPSNATLCVAGDFDSTHMKETIAKYYGTIKNKTAQAHQSVELQRTPIIKERTVLDSVPLPAMLLMWHSPEFFGDGDAEADVLSSILAGQASSNLSKKLMYDEQLVQDVSVFQYSRGRGSVFIVYIDALEDTDLDQVARTVQAELDGLASGEIAISEENLNAILKNWEMDFLWGLESIQEQAETLQRYNHYLGDTDYLGKDLKRYQDVSPESIQKLISSYLTADKAAKLILLPEESSKGEDE
jgi:predicted Zn-dependent peptidase